MACTGKGGWGGTEGSIRTPSLSPLDCVHVSGCVYCEYVHVREFSVLQCIPRFPFIVCVCSDVFLCIYINTYKYVYKHATAGPCCPDTKGQQRYWASSTATGRGSQAASVVRYSYWILPDNHFEVSKSIGGGSSSPCTIATSCIFSCCIS